MLPIHYSLFITMLRNKLRLMIKKNKMKNTIKQLGICLVLSALSLLPVLTACSDNDDEPAAPEIVISENILTNGMNFPKQEERAHFLSSRMCRWKSSAIRIGVR